MTTQVLILLLGHLQTRYWVLSLCIFNNYHNYEQWERCNDDDGNGMARPTPIMDICCVFAPPTFKFFYLAYLARNLLHTAHQLFRYIYRKNTFQDTTSSTLSYFQVWIFVSLLISWWLPTCRYISFLSSGANVNNRSKYEKHRLLFL